MLIEAPCYKEVVPKRDDDARAQTAPRTIVVFGLLAAAALVATSVACGSRNGPGAMEGDGSSGGAPASSAGDLVIPPIGTDAGAGPGLFGKEITTAEVVIDPYDTRSTLMTERDPRLAKRRPRSRALVLTEVQQLERLLDTTKLVSPERGQLRRRIAEDYNELAQTSSGPDAARARSKSIEQYTGIVNETPSYALLDEVLYFRGLAFELNGDLKNARSSYYELIRRMPQSKLIPLAYFAFGEMFFGEAAADALKNELAKQAFNEVLKYPAADNPVFAEALLRLGQTYLRMKDDAEAKKMFDRLARDFAGSPAAAQLPSVRP